jgi:N-acetylmuramoyl-L-alanine amidase
MTRSQDVFVSLDERVAISRRHQGDLFVSIHADSLPTREAARTVRGATVYTLAEQASDDAARRVADKENAVDLLAGLPVTQTDDEQVRDILIDLMRRESQGFANDFRRSLLGALRPTARLSRDPERSGPFRVLRQPATPAVLIELGYISNAEDEKQMLSVEWQSRVAESVARAVDGHFRVRTARR